MIIGTKDVMETYRGISERLDRAIDFALAFDPASPCGRYVIDGEDVYANVITGNTTPMDEVVYEAHKKYIDLHLMLEGGEIMVYAPIAAGVPQSEYDEAGDARFYKGEGLAVRVNPGDFYIVHPFDLHAPGKGDAPSAFKKMIVKIRV